MPVGHRGPAARTQENRRSKSLRILGKVDLATFERDGYVVVRGAVSAKVAEACRRAIWEGIHYRAAHPRLRSVRGGLRDVVTGKLSAVRRLEA
jgi:hypothetical protein